jgi:predicted permease
MLSDLNYAWRQLRKSPGFALTAVLTLALGIGGVTAVFSVVDAVLLRPLPYPQANRLIVLHEGLAHLFSDSNLSAPDVITFERESRVFTAGGFTGSEYEATGAGAPFRAKAERLTAAVFPVLGVEPLLGRVFTEQEDEQSAPVTVISYALWKERFNGDANVVGKTIDLDRRPYTIIGVMPEPFETPDGLGSIAQRQLWVPMSFTPAEKAAEADDFDYGAVARLKPGATEAQAQQDAERVVQAINAKVPGLDLTATVHGLKEQTVKEARPLLRTLLAAVGLILLIACANLANLLLVRAAGRRREFGVRLALGAARRTMLRQALLESLVLSAMGGVLGVSLAAMLVDLAPALLPKVASDLPRVNEIAIHWPVAALAIGLICATGLVCGLAPAMASMRAEVLDALRDGSQGAGQGRSQHRLRNGLVMAEVALAMVLLVGAGLLLRSFGKMLATDPGFEPEHVMTAYLALPEASYPSQEKADEFFGNLQQKLEALPGVKAVGLSSNIPVIGHNSSRLLGPEGYVRKPGEQYLFASNYLTAGNYFAALRIPVLRGRGFTAADDQPGAPLVMIISQSFAHQFFAGKDPVGMHVKAGPSYSDPMPPMRIVGVVGDVKANPLDQKQTMQTYEPVSQAARELGPLAAMVGVIGNLRVVVRTAGDPRALEASFTQAVHGADPLLPITNLHTMDEVVAETEAPRRFNTTVLTTFAAIALGLALLGIYGVLSFAVTERTREIAIRMALGATREDVQRRTLRQAVLLGLIGVAGGLAAAAALTQSLKSLLYGVQPLDGVTLSAAVLVLLVCAALAGWIPARRAASVEPMEALRNE